MKPLPLKLKQMLAAEYVTGTLVGAARRRFQRMLAQDGWLRGEVAYWEQRFAELGVFEPVPPREIVWTEIEMRLLALSGKPGVIEPRIRRLRLSVNFWRTWSGLATAASLILALVLLRNPEAPPRGPDPPQRVLEVRVPVQNYVAAVRLPNEDVQWTVSIQPDMRSLRVIVNGPVKLGADEDYELWWLGDEGVTSLGLLPRSGAWETLLPISVRPKGAGKVAISLEPAGGSQAEVGPSGPVLLAAPLVPSI